MPRGADSGRFSPEMDVLNFGLVNHAHGLADLVEGRGGNLAGATVALVQDVGDVAHVLGDLLAALADGSEVAVDGLGHYALELAVQMPAVVRRPEISGRFSGSKVMLRSESLLDFLIRRAVSSAVMEMEMALP